jgi:hypothetical protein
MKLEKRIKAAAPWVILFVLSVLCYLHAYVYRLFIADDALISLRYAQRFISGEGLTWTPGERVEGYTNFLWVILSALGGSLGFDLIAFARFLDHVGAIGALWILGLSPRSGRLSLARLLLAGPLFVASVPVAVWAQGGLEHAFMLLPLAGALYLLQRKYSEGYILSRLEYFLLASCLAALVLLRADGLILVFFALGAAFLTSVQDLKKIFSIFISVSKDGLVPLFTWLLQLGFRFWYYGQWMPNTATAKLSFNQVRVWLGANYVFDGLKAMSVMLVVGVVATIGLYRYGKKKMLLLMGSIFFGWMFYVSSVGGDTFPGWRQLLFLFVPLGFVIAEISELLVEKKSKLSWSVFIIPVLILPALHLIVQRFDSENIRAKNELWEWDAFSIGPLLKKSFAVKSPLHAVDAAGALPYVTGFPSLDMLGLNDAYIAHHPPSDFGYGSMGHELGDGAYVFQRRPDLISFNNAGGSAQPVFLSGRQLLSIPAFHREYQWVRFRGVEGNQAIAEIWIRREGGKIGLVRSDDKVTVPGYFMTGAASDAYATLNNKNQLVAKVSSHAPGVLPPLELQAGVWKVHISDLSADALVDVRCELKNGVRSAEKISKATQDFVIQVDTPMRLGIAVAPSLQSNSFLEISEISFVKTAVSDRINYICRESPLKISLDELFEEKPTHLFWSHPGNVVLGQEGLDIAIHNKHFAKGMRLTLDNNDSYKISVQRQGNIIFEKHLAPAGGGAGLANYSVDFPDKIIFEPNDLIHVAPIHGDGSFSLGSLILVP